jgi:hypothetical protein
MMKKEKMNQCMDECGCNQKKCKNGGCCKSNCGKCDSGLNILYGLGLIGTAIYYISTATSFWAGVLGVLKAIVWPAILTFELLLFLGL